MPKFRVAQKFVSDFATSFTKYISQDQSSPKKLTIRDISAD